MSIANAVVVDAPKLFQNELAANTASSDDSSDVGSEVCDLGSPRRADLHTGSGSESKLPDSQRSQEQTGHGLIRSRSAMLVDIGGDASRVHDPSPSQSPLLSAGNQGLPTTTGESLGKVRKGTLSAPKVASSGERRSNMLPAGWQVIQPEARQLSQVTRQLASPPPEATSPGHEQTPQLLPIVPEVVERMSMVEIQTNIRKSLMLFNRSKLKQQPQAEYGAPLPPVSPRSLRPLPAHVRAGASHWQALAGVSVAVANLKLGAAGAIAGGGTDASHSPRVEVAVRANPYPSAEPPPPAPPLPLQRSVPLPPSGLRAPPSQWSAVNDARYTISPASPRPTLAPLAPLSSPTVSSGIHRNTLTALLAGSHFSGIGRGSVTCPAAPASKVVPPWDAAIAEKGASKSPTVDARRVTIARSVSPAPPIGRAQPTPSAAPTPPLPGAKVGPEASHDSEHAWVRNYLAGDFQTGMLEAFLASVPDTPSRRTVK